jgi:hypothetical protein
MVVAGAPEKVIGILESKLTLIEGELVDIMSLRRVNSLNEKVYVPSADHLMKSVKVWRREWLRLSTKGVIELATEEREHWPRTVSISHPTKRIAFHLSANLSKSLLKLRTWERGQEIPCWSGGGQMGTAKCSKPSTGPKGGISMYCAPTT